MKSRLIRSSALATFLVLGLALIFINGCTGKLRNSPEFGADSCYVKVPPSLPGVDTFMGRICLDVRDSESDWGPFTPEFAPKNAPNILFVLYDDTGLGAWSPYGGKINMPTLNSIAEDGLTYTQWHTTALCSPTRSTILTGRSHHLNGMASITETADGFPGSNGRVPPSCASFAEVLHENGYATFWVGKNHNVPEPDVAPGGDRSEWPCQIGFDRFYGFLGGETNNWFPDLVEDNHFIEQPYGPEEGYHLSKDLADKSIEMLRNLNASHPSKPFYLWFNPGANHAPHHAPAEYIAKYKGKFDEGYDAYRQWVSDTMKTLGIIPPNTVLTHLNPMLLYPDESNPTDSVISWEKLDSNQQKLFSRMAEVYAGFSEYTDAQVGRIVEYLKETGQYDNTIIIYAADNGASGEGTPVGSVNENKFFNGYPDDMEENMELINDIGSEKTYNHFPTGWASAFSSPFKMFKRYSQFAGGTNCPLVISWPDGIKDRGALRHQYHHSVDIVPTLLEAIGLSMPDTFRGVPQIPLSGTSMFYTFKQISPDADTRKEVQYYSMLGTRGIWKDGWKAVAIHAPTSGKGFFEQDVWELYNVAEDRSEYHNLAGKPEYKDKLAELIDAWFDEAYKNRVLPLDDRVASELLTVERPSSEPDTDTYNYYPYTAPVPEGVAANLRGRSYKITAKVKHKVGENPSGVMFAHGSRFGGHALFIKDGYLYYIYNFLGISDQQYLLKSTNQIFWHPGENTLQVHFALDPVLSAAESEYGEWLGVATLYINGQEAGSLDIKTQPAKFTLSGDGLCVGYDSGDQVTEEYPNPSRFTGSELKYVEVKEIGEAPRNIKADVRRMMLRE